MTKSNLTRHSKFPFLPSNITVTGNPKCSGCPLSNAAGHETCVSFKPASDAGEENKIRLSEMRGWQWMVRRKDSDFIPENDWGSRRENARDSYNFADAVTGEITGASGNTLTLEFDTDPRNLQLYASRMPEPEIGIGWITGMGGFGVLRPGMRITYSQNSILAYKSKPTIKKIVSRSGNSVTFEIDQECGMARTPTPEAIENEDDEVFTASVWNMDGNVEKWLHIFHPTFFYGVRRLLPITTIPSNGIVTLANKPVAHPGGFDPLKPNFVLEGRRIDNNSWETISADNRLFIDNEISTVALKTTVPDNAVEGMTLSEDLTETYSQFRVTFYEESDGAGNCEIVAYGRCKHDTPDYTNSIHNYGAENGTGVVGGRHWFCGERKTAKFTFEDTNEDGLNDTAVLGWETASGAPTYRPGRCLKYNTCNKFTAAESDHDAFFRYHNHASRFFRELWFRSNAVIRQKLPGFNHPMNYVIERIGHASLAWLTGYIGPLNTDNGYHPSHVFMGCGAWAPYAIWQYPEETEIEGDYLAAISGFNWAGRLPFDEMKYSLSVAAEEGFYPDNVADFKDQRDPLNAGAIVEVMEILGTRVTRDTGEIYGRGTASAGKVAGDAPVIIPNVAFDDTNPQRRDVGEFVRYDEPVNILGVDYGGHVEIYPLRQVTKEPTSIGSRTVYSITKSGNEYTIDFENVEQAWSKVKPLFMEDEILRWRAGGAHPIYATDYLRPNSSYHDSNQNKSFGSPSAGCRPGDVISVSGVGLEEQRFIIKEVLPHGGSEASTWGQRIEGAVVSTDQGCYKFSNDDINLISVIFTDTSAAAVSAGAIRPRTIGAGKYFFDLETNCLYASPADDGRTLEIKYTVGDDPYEHTGYLYISETVDIYTGIDSFDWTGAVSVTLTYEDGTPLTSGTPTTIGKYSADTSGGNVILTINLNDVNRLINVKMEMDDYAPTPDDGWSWSLNYTSYGKKRDRIVVIDEAGYLNDKIGLIPGQPVSFHWADGVFYPGTTLQFTPYGVDSWTTVTGALSEHGRGRFYIPEAWFVDKTGGCFKA